MHYRQVLMKHTGIRLPLTWLSERYHGSVGEALQLAGIDSK